VDAQVYIKLIKVFFIILKAERERHMYLALTTLKVIPYLILCWNVFLTCLMLKILSLRKTLRVVVF